MRLITIKRCRLLHRVTNTQVNKIDLCDSEGFNILQMYLMQYGYLRMTESADPIEEFRSSDEVRLAVEELQKMAGLPVTGQFDAATVNQMKKPRCGVRDLVPPSGNGGPENFEVGSTSWQKTDINYR
jgi:Putative peptidoglycan binding domain